MHGGHLVEAGGLGVDPVVPVEGGEIAGVPVGFPGVPRLVEPELGPINGEGLGPPR